MAPVDLAARGPAAAAAAATATASSDPTHLAVHALGAGLTDGVALLHVPARLPAAAPGGGLAPASALAPGIVGRLLVLASGAVKATLGGIEFDVVPGLPVDALTAAMLVAPPPSAAAASSPPSTPPGPSAPPAPSSRRSAAMLGQVTARAALVPCVESLLSGGSGPPRRPRAKNCKTVATLNAEYEACQKASVVTNGVADMDLDGGEEERPVVLKGQGRAPRCERRQRLNEEERAFVFVCVSDCQQCLFFCVVRYQWGGASFCEQARPRLSLSLFSPASPQPLCHQKGDQPLTLNLFHPPTTQNITVRIPSLLHKTKHPPPPFPPLHLARRDQCSSLSTASLALYAALR